MELLFLKNFKIKGFNKYIKKELKKDRLLKKNNHWFFKYCIKYNKLDFDDDSLKNKFKRKLYSFLSGREYKLFMRYQKKLRHIYDIHLGYTEYSDIFNHILYLTTCMGIEYRNFGNAVNETIRDEVRTLWKFRRMVKDYLKIENNFYDRQDNIVKRKFGKNTTLKLELSDNKEDNRTLKSQFKYINNDIGISAEILSYHDVVAVDPNIGIYPSQDSSESAEEKYQKEFFNHMMEFFYKHYRKWWD